MKVSRAATVAWEQAEPAHFSGSGRVQRMPPSREAPTVKIYRVEFEPAARTNWHVHSGVQLLFVVKGRCRIQKWGEEVKEAAPGDTVYILPGEKHWHGAGPDACMAHIAVNLNAETTWMEKVSDQQYSVPPR